MGNYDRQNKWISENMYRMNIVMKKEFREEIEQAVERSGMSKNGYIIQAIKEKIERDQASAAE